VRVRLRAWRSDDPSRGATFLPGDKLCWDISQKSDLVVFELENVPFTAKRAEFLASVEVEADK